jgi:tetratricopeptide (TPR) repeat protein
MALKLAARDEDALPVLTRVIQLAEALGDHECLCEALFQVALIYEERGEFQQSRHCAERALLTAQRFGDPVLSANMTIRLGVIAYFTGEWEQARSMYEQVEAICRQLDIPPTSWLYGGLALEWGRLSWVRGDWEAASRYLEQSRIIWEPQGNRMGLRPTQQVLAERDLLEGRPEQALARLFPLLDRPGLEERSVTTHVLPMLAWAYLELGDTGQAERTIAEAIRRARAREYWRSLAETLRVQALMALRQGRWDVAGRALEEGLALARAMPYPRAEGRLLETYGELYAELEEWEAARERLEAARTTYQRLGARKDLERTEQLLAVLG